MMLRPTILPGEFAPGYLGRIMQLNAYKNSKVTTRFIHATFSNEGRPLKRSTRTIPLLAHTAGLDVASFISRHTMLMLQHGVIYTPPCPSVGTSLVLIAKYAGIDAMRHGAYLCMRCVEADFDNFGMPYWHRDHQIPGVYWCALHGNTLSWVESASAFNSSPTSALASLQSAPAWLTHEMRNYPIIRSFCDLTNDLVNYHQRVHMRELVHATRTLIPDWSPDSGWRGQNKETARELFEQPPYRMWLESIFTLPHMHQLYDVCDLVDAVIEGYCDGGDAVVYILALAILLELSEGAIDPIFQFIDSTTTY